MQNETSQPGNLTGQAGYRINNFDPNSINEDEVILVALVMDVSPSVEPFEADLNTAFEAFVEEMKKSHVKDKLMIKTIEFSEKIYEKTGFMRVVDMDASNFNFKAKDSGTALYDAAKKGLDEVIEYRDQLEKTGINTKVLLFVITDGQDNSSKLPASAVKDTLDKILGEERNVFSFETILFGVGNSGSFKQAQQDMGFKHLAQVGTSGAEIRKMIGFISASISSSSAGQAVTF